MHCLFIGISLVRTLNFLIDIKRIINAVINNIKFILNNNVRSQKRFSLCVFDTQIQSVFS